MENYSIKYLTGPLKIGKVIEKQGKSEKLLQPNRDQRMRETVETSVSLQGGLEDQEDLTQKLRKAE